MLSLIYDFNFLFFFFFFFNDTATTEIYTLSLHDALPIFPLSPVRELPPQCRSAVHPESTSKTRSRAAAIALRGPTNRLVRICIPSAAGTSFEHLVERRLRGVPDGIERSIGTIRRPGEYRALF